MLAGAKIALAEDMAEGDFTRLLRAVRIVLKLQGDDLARLGSRWQMRCLKDSGRGSKWE